MDTFIIPFKYWKQDKMVAVYAYKGKGIIKVLTMLRIEVWIYGEVIAWFPYVGNQEGTGWMYVCFSGRFTMMTLVDIQLEMSAWLKKMSTYILLLYNTKIHYI